MNLQETAACSKLANYWFWSIVALCLPICPVLLCSIKRRLRAGKQRKQLPGKVVLITGASSGLGEALAHAFFAEGCQLILAARRLEELERVKQELLATQPNAVHKPAVLPLDLAELNDIDNFAKKALSLFSRIDILINNGGISVRSSIESTSLDVDIKILNVNYLGTVALTKAILPSMVQRKAGHISFISSVQGKFALPYRSSYSASKHAMQAFADCLRAEVKSKGLEVSCISPGYIQTQLSVNALTGSGARYGKMDATTASGMSAAAAANRILHTILANEKDVLVCDLKVKIAYYLRFLCPHAYFKIMEKRALKEEKAV